MEKVKTRPKMAATQDKLEANTQPKSSETGSLLLLGSLLLGLGALLNTKSEEVIEVPNLKDLINDTHFALSSISNLDDVDKWMNSETLTEELNGYIRELEKAKEHFTSTTDRIAISHTIDTATQIIWDIADLKNISVEETECEENIVLFDSGYVISRDPYLETPDSCYEAAVCRMLDNGESEYDYYCQGVRLPFDQWFAKVSEPIKVGMSEYEFSTTKHNIVKMKSSHKILGEDYECEFTFEKVDCCLYLNAHLNYYDGRVKRLAMRRINGLHDIKYLMSMLYPAWTPNEHLTFAKRIMSCLDPETYNAIAT